MYSCINNNDYLWVTYENHSNYAEVIGVAAELPFAVFASALFVASLTSWNFSTNFVNSASDEKPKPYTVLARTSLHWPNFWDVWVKLINGVMVELMTALLPSTLIMRYKFLDES